MIIKIAWRNIWRNKVRSLVVIIAIALGLWAGAFTSGFYEGMVNQKIQDVIAHEISHVQFHDTLFRDELDITRTLDDVQRIEEVLQSDSLVKAYSMRVISTTMMASAKKSGGIKMVGISPSDEHEVTSLGDKLVVGAYFEGVNRNPILISRRVAEDYGLKEKSKVVMTLQDVNRDIVASSFRVVGIFDSDNGMFDQANVFVRSEDIQKVLGLDDGGYHEVAVLMKENGHSEQRAAAYAEQFPDLEVLPWLDIQLGMRYMVEAGDTFALVIVAIILVALLFSIVNTMLMAVMERTREIGMLMAIGFNKNKVFSMILLETVFLSLVGAPIGLGIAFAMIERMGVTGFDLGAIGETYSDLGFAAVVYPSLEIGSYVNITLMVLVMAVIASIYPARKALKLNPSEAIRKI